MSFGKAIEIMEDQIKAFNVALGQEQREEKFKELVKLEIELCESLIDRFKNEMKREGKTEHLINAINKIEKEEPVTEQEPEPEEKKEKEGMF